MLPLPRRLFFSLFFVVAVDILGRAFFPCFDTRTLTTTKERGGGLSTPKKKKKDQQFFRQKKREMTSKGRQKTAAKKKRKTCVFMGWVVWR